MKMKNVLAVGYRNFDHTMDDWNYTCRLIQRKAADLNKPYTSYHRNKAEKRFIRRIYESIESIEKLQGTERLKAHRHAIFVLGGYYAREIDKFSVEYVDCLQDKLDQLFYLQ